jgi:hypothetical protein
MASENKLKFIEYVQPTNVLSMGGVYRADGTIERAEQQQPDLGYQQRVNEETVLRFGGNCGRSFEVPFAGRMVELCHERERNLDPSGYIRNGSMVGRGFGQIDTFSQLQFGQMTRQSMVTADDIENDRIHALNRNYGVVGFFPYPEDTRYVNKTYAQL